MNRLLFESSPFFIFLCLILGVGYAYILYKAKHPWSKRWNRFLFGVRATVVFFLAFLILGPIIKQIRNTVEKPVFIVLNDNSQSINEANDSIYLQKIQQEISLLSAQLAEAGYEVAVTDLSSENTGTLVYSFPVSDLSGSIKKITNRFEGRKIAGMALLSDGIYNSGISPLYATYQMPIYSVGLGDTTQQRDISIQRVNYNKIAYQGNQFPLHVEIRSNGFSGEEISVSVVKNGKSVVRKSSRIKNNWTAFDFEISAYDDGLQRYSIQVEQKSGESNSKNNQATVFVEVVKGKKRVAIVASAPHPDVK
ncbi:MAG: hypothetical protein L0Y35_00620, partial [Flammeovirgaceae bacterium]|nr:hypothetical protein [Flammeovirgaceae bacterium]